VTDLPPNLHNVPSRLGVTLGVEGDELVGRLVPYPEVCERGPLAASALVLLADVVAGVSVDTDPDLWLFTSDISVRTPLTPPPKEIEARSTTVRAGRRSVTCEVPFVADGSPWGTCFIGFASVPRRDGDPPKPMLKLGPDARYWQDMPPLDAPLRDAVGVERRDPSIGQVSLALRPEVQNPAGTLQGAMVSYLAEAAAHDLADHHLGVDGGAWAVTDLEVRFLAQNRLSPITSRAWFVGPPSDGLVRVDLFDEDGEGRRTTAALARVRRPVTAD